MMAFVDDTMLGLNPSYNELILAAVGCVNFLYAHAGAFIRCQIKKGAPFLKYLDNKNDIELYHPRSPPLLAGDQLKPKEDFGKFFVLRLFAIEKKVIADAEERLRIENTIKWVMTGVEDHVKERESSGTAASHKKRKNLR